MMKNTGELQEWGAWVGTQEMRFSENVEFDFKKEHLEFILIGGKEKMSVQILEDE